MGSTKFSTTTALALAAVVLSSSTTVFAVAKIPRHSVGHKQLKTSAVTNKKIAKHAVTGSKVASNTLTGTQINESSLGDVPSAANATALGQRFAFGKGNATDVPATTLLSLPRLGVTVSTDGDAGITNEVTVTLPTTPGFSWIFGVEGQAMFSSKGGAVPLSVGPTINSLTAHIWRFDNSQSLFLHCAFDNTGFTTSRPLSCWATST